MANKKELGCSGCGHEAVGSFLSKRGKFFTEFGLNKPSGEMACGICIRNPSYKDMRDLNIKMIFLKTPPISFSFNEEVIFDGNGEVECKDRYTTLKEA